MAITTMDALVAGIASGQYIQCIKASISAKAAGDFQSLWTATGFPTPGSAPGSASGAAPTSATTGAIPFTNPSGSNTMYLAQWQLTNGQTGTFMLYDRLVHTSALSGTVSGSAQTINSAALTRQTSGAGVQMWVEFYTATGSSATTATIAYTNQSGSSATTPSFTFPATPVVGQMLQVPLASGDTGVQSVQSLTLAGSTGTAGNFGVTLANPLCATSISSSNTGQLLDYAQVSLPVVDSNACLALMDLASTTSTGQLLTGLTLAQG